MKSSAEIALEIVYRYRFDLGVYTYDVRDQIAAAIQAERDRAKVLEVRFIVPALLNACALVILLLLRFRLSLSITFLTHCFGCKSHVIYD